MCLGKLKLAPYIRAPPQGDRGRTELLHGGKDLSR